jgi:hypothetical protein
MLLLSLSPEVQCLYFEWFGSIVFTDTEQCFSYELLIFWYGCFLSDVHFLVCLMPAASEDLSSIVQFLAHECVDKRGAAFSACLANNKRRRIV